MTTLTATPVKTITYDRLTGDYKMELNGEFVGYERSYHSAEVELDRLAYEALNRAGIEPELLLSATALDGGSDPDEIAAEYAATIGDPARDVDERSCERCDRVTVHRLVATYGTFFCGSCSVCFCGSLAIYGGTTPCCQTCHDAALADLEPDQPADDPGHDLTLPDPAECPDISAPQPVEDLSACERYSTPPALAFVEPEPEPVPAWLNAPIDLARCANCDGPHHIQRCPEVWRALTG